MTDQTLNALQIIREACAAVSATLPAHQKIQAAIQHVEDELNTKTKDKEKGTS